jgi:hypothetical protein
MFPVRPQRCTRPGGRCLPPIRTCPLDTNWASTAPSKATMAASTAASRQTLVWCRMSRSYAVSSTTPTGNCAAPREFENLQAGRGRRGPLFLNRSPRPLRQRIWPLPGFRLRLPQSLTWPECRLLAGTRTLKSTAGPTFRIQLGVEWVCYGVEPLPYRSGWNGRCISEPETAGGRYGRVRRPFHCLSAMQ